MVPETFYKNSLSLNILINLEKFSSPLKLAFCRICTLLSIRAILLRLHKDLCLAKGEKAPLLAI